VLTVHRQWADIDSTFSISFFHDTTQTRGLTPDIPGPSAATLRSDVTETHHSFGPMAGRSLVSGGEQ